MNTIIYYIIILYYITYIILYITIILVLYINYYYLNFIGVGTNVAINFSDTRICPKYQNIVVGKDPSPPPLK